MTELDDELWSESLPSFNPVTRYSPSPVSGRMSSHAWIVKSLGRDLRSQNRGTGPQLVPAGMIVKAWRHLQRPAC